MNNCEISINSISKEELYNIHFLCDNDFIPALSSRVDLKEYTTKLYKNADFVILRKDNIIAGLVALYCNDFDNYSAYISSVCILPEFRGLKLGNVLIEECIKYCKEKGMKSITLEVSKENLVALNLYSKFGFKFSDGNESQLLMKKSIN